MDLAQTDIDEAYWLALEICEDSCRDYHATRPYLVASGVRQGPDRDQEVFSSLLRTLVAPEDRILIAGAADVGLLQFVHTWAGERRPRITVADRCSTPLILCQRYAKRAGLRVHTVETDLVGGSAIGQFDLIIAHAIIQFVPPSQRLRFLKHLASMLASNGRVLLAAGLGGTSSEMRANQRTRVLEALHLRNLTLPSPPDPLLAAIERQANDRGEPFDDDAAESEGLYRDAGLRVTGRHEALRSANRGGGPGLPRGRRYIILEQEDRNR